jgi:hypothetical protein
VPLVVHHVRKGKETDITLVKFVKNECVDMYGGNDKMKINASPPKSLFAPWATAHFVLYDATGQVNEPEFGLGTCQLSVGRLLLLYGVEDPSFSKNTVLAHIRRYVPVKRKCQFAETKMWCVRPAADLGNTQACVVVNARMITTRLHIIRDPRQDKPRCDPDLRGAVFVNSCVDWRVGGNSNP